MFATDMCTRTRYTFPMIAQWLMDAMAHKGWGQSELARRLTDAYPSWAGDRSKIYKATKGKRKLSAEELYQISDVTGFQIPDGVIDQNAHPTWEEPFRREIRQALSAGARPEELRAIVEDEAPFVARDGHSALKTRIAESDEEVFEKSARFVSDRMKRKTKSSGKEDSRETH